MFAPMTPLTERSRNERENREHRVALYALVSPDPARVMTFLSSLARRRPALPRPERSTGQTSPLAAKQG